MNDLLQDIMFDFNDSSSSNSNDSLTCNTMVDDAKNFFHRLESYCNDNGDINVEVLKNLFENDLNVTLKDDYIKGIFKDGVNDHGNGSLDFLEFLTVFSFVMFDLNEDGELDHSEIKQLVNIFYGDKISDQEVQEWIEELLDEDGNGKISYNEWHNFVLGVILDDHLFIYDKNFTNPTNSSTTMEFFVKVADNSDENGNINGVVLKKLFHGVFINIAIYQGKSVF